MFDRLEIEKTRKIKFRVIAVVISSLSVISGIMYAYFEESLWPLLPAGFILFYSYNLWIRTCWILEVGSGGILLTCNRKRFFLPWSAIGEFAPGNSVENNKVEFTLSGEEPLSDAYQGNAYLKLRFPRFLPDTFGMSAKELADFLNNKKKEHSPTIAIQPTSAPPVG
jgi:hypothetical protein